MYIIARVCRRQTVSLPAWRSVTTPGAAWRSPASAITCRTVKTAPMSRTAKQVSNRSVQACSSSEQNTASNIVTHVQFTTPRRYMSFGRQSFVQHSLDTHVNTCYREIIHAADVIALKIAALRVCVFKSDA